MLKKRLKNNMARKTKRQLEYKLVEIKRKFGTNPDGSPRRRSFYGKTKAQAEAAYEEALRELHIQEAAEYRDSHGDSDITFKEWADKWLSLKWGSVREISYSTSYEAPTENKLIPMFGKRKLKDITKSELQMYINSKSRYSFSELANLKLCLKQIFQSAADENLISKNPAQNLKLPKNTTDRVIIKRAYTYDQARIVIDFAKTHKYGIDILLMLKAGLRRSELLILPFRFTDELTGGIDIDNDMIRIRQSVAESKYGIEISPCKSKRSMRNVPIDSELHEIIAAMSNKIDYNGKTYDRRYIVSSGYGNFYYPTSYKRRYSKFMDDFQEYCKKNGLDIPALTPHELRHSFGSILYERGVDIVTISKLMGHANVQTTVGLYVHDNEDLNRQAINMAL